MVRRTPSTWRLAANIEVTTAALTKFHRSCRETRHQALYRDAPLDLTGAF
jgi:hypothetical protein